MNDMRMKRSVNAPISSVLCTRLFKLHCIY